MAKETSLRQILNSFCNDILKHSLSFKRRLSFLKIRVFLFYILILGERTGLMVRASDSGSGDPGSILGRVGVLFP